MFTRLFRAIATAFLLTATLAAQDLTALNTRIATALTPADLHQQLALRAPVFAALLREHPQQARTQAIPVNLRAQILRADPTAAPFLEQDTPLTGELTAAVADDWDHDRAITRYTLHTPTADTDLAFTGTLDYSQFLHRPVTITGLSLPGIAAVESLREASPAECSSLQPAATYPASHTETAAPATCSTLGQQKIAVLILHFPAGSPTYPTGLDTAAYWQNVVTGPNPSVNAFWNEVSYGQTSAAADVYPNITLAQAYDCTQTSAMQTAAIAAAAATVDFTQYNRVLLVFPVTSCSFGGLGTIGCSSATTTIGHQYSTTWIPVTPSYNTSGYPQMWGGVSHELGHNLGLNHANTLDFGGIALGPLDFTATNPGTVGAPTPPGTPTAASTTPITAVNTEYGDHFALIGYPWTSGGPYSAQHRVKLLGWIPQSDSRDITSYGQFNLSPAENSSGLRALHVLRDPASGSWLWLEFHQPLGFYTPANIAAFPGNTLATGAQIHYENAFANSLYTYLLDMTPSATAPSNNFYDGTLAPGQSWSDPYSLLSLTAGNQTSGASGTLAITVGYDAPCANVVLTAPILPASGGTGNLNILAYPTCSWTATSNAPWLTFTGATSGIGTAVIPYAAAANPTAVQRQTYVTAQRQSLPLIQSGATITLTAVTPNAGTSAPAVLQPFTIAYNDAAGLADVTQINLAFAGNPACQIAATFSGASAYLYVLNGNTYSASVLAGSTQSASSTLCTIDGASSKYTPSGTSATLTLGVIFATSSLGVHNLTAGAVTSSGGYGALLPFGYWTVAAPAVIPITTPTLTWPKPAAIPYGTALSAAQLNATSTAPGTFTYTPALGTLLTAGPQTLSTVFTPTDATAYTTATASVTLTVSQLTPTLTWLPPASIPYGTALSAAQLNATSTAPGTFTYTPAPGTLLSAGSQTLTATFTPTDPVDYTTATASNNLTIAKAAATLTLTAPSTAGTGTTFNLTATATSTTTGTPTGTVAFYAGTTSLGTGTLNANTYTLPTTLPIGTYTLTSSYSGDSNFTPASAPPVSITITGLPDYTLTATPTTVTVAPSQTATYTLTATPLNGFASPIAYACGTLPTHATCTFSTTANSATLNIATSVATAAATPSPLHRYLPIALALLILPFLHRRRFAALLSLAVIATITGCSTSNSITPPDTATPAGSYTITVTATSGTLTHTIPLTLNLH